MMEIRFVAWIPLPIHYINNGIVLSIFIVILLTCRRWPRVVDFFYFFVMNLYGPIVTELYSDVIFFSWVGIFIFPGCILIITRSRLYFILSSVIQTVYLNTLRHAALIDQLQKRGDESFLSVMTLVSIVMLVINMFLLVFLDTSIKSAQLLVAESKKLEFALAQQKTFLQSISHELRNLPNSVLGCIQAALLEKLPQEIQSLLETAHIGGELLLHLINNILDRGKMDTGELEITPFDINLREALR